MDAKSRVGYAVKPGGAGFLGSTNAGPVRERHENLARRRLGGRRAFGWKPERLLSSSECMVTKVHALTEERRAR
jgi:hypothetical protein